MALERIPADIRADGGIARMSDPALIKVTVCWLLAPISDVGGDGECEHPRDGKGSHR